MSIPLPYTCVQLKSWIDFWDSFAKIGNVSNVQQLYKPKSILEQSLVVRYLLVSTIVLTGYFIFNTGQSLLTQTVSHFTSELELTGFYCITQVCLKVFYDCMCNNLVELYDIQCTEYLTILTVTEPLTGQLD